jgi:hypothetical protein
VPTPASGGEDVFPDRSMEHRDKIAWMIETDGWAFAPVRDANPPYGYTVGLDSGFGFPEVVVFGLQPVAARGLVGLVVDLLREGTRPPIDAPFVGLLDDDLPCALVTVDTAAHLDLFEAASMWHRRTTFAVVQLVWPDRAGLLPWDDGFSEHTRAMQPVLTAPTP